MKKRTPGIAHAFRWAFSNVSSPLCRKPEGSFDTPSRKSFRVFQIDKFYCRPLSIPHRDSGYRPRPSWPLSPGANRLQKDFRGWAYGRLRVGGPFGLGYNRSVRGQARTLLPAQGIYKITGLRDNRAHTRVER